MRRPLFAAALCMVIFAAVLLQSGAADRNKPGCIRAEQLYTAGMLRVTGQVYQKNETSIYIKSVILSISDASGQLNPESEQKVPCQDNLICELEEALELPLGCVVELEGVFAPFSHATNPGEFDSADYYKTLGIGGKVKKAVVLKQGKSYWRIREALSDLKYFLKERLCRIMPPKEAAVMSALLLGDKEDMDSEMKELYKRNGILHILSISSLHITIIGMSVYKLLRKAGIPVCPAALAGSILLLLYGGMVGFGVSACRAIGMYLIKMLGEMAGRTYDMLTALGVMGAAMALYNPFYLQHSGFLLSFACCLGIGIFSPVLAPEKTRIPKFLSGSLITSLSITVVTLPIQLWFYYEVPVYSVLLNLLVIPFMKPMMISGILALAGLGWLGTVDCLILRGYEFLCGCFDKLPFHTWNPGRPGIVQIIVYYLMLFAFAAAGKARTAGEKGEAEKKPGKQRLEGGFRMKGHIRGIAKWCLLGLALLELGLKPPLKNSVTFLDVGQGDCIVVRTSSGQNYLFDCGSTSRSGVGKYVLLPYLKYHGIRNIDALFLSHPDADHVNGALELFELGKENNITVRQMVLPAIEEKARQEQLGELVSAAEAASFDRPVRITYLSAGESWECAGAGFTCLHPDRNDSGEDVNAYSECFLVEFRERGRRAGNGGKAPEYRWTVLLTGDVEGKGEEKLLEELQRRQIRDVWVLKAAHHGSRNSTSEEFLAQTAPRVAILSCGKDNQYGHPHRELMERLEASGTYILQTARSGAVTVTYGDGKIKVRAYLP